MNELVMVEKSNALAVFTTPELMEPLLKQIRAEIDGFTPDVSTATSRKLIASMAYKVAQSKTYLDGIGKELADAQKEIPRKIDASRKKVRDTLDAWRDEVRRPLTEWEAAEDARVAEIRSVFGELKNLSIDATDRTAEAMRERLAEVESIAITAERFAEFTTRIAEAKDAAILHLKARIAEQEKREADAAELDQLRAEAEERARKDAQEKAEKEQAERDARIASDAAERAKAEAERKAKAEADKKEAERLAAIAAQQAAERRAAEAEAKATQEAEARENNRKRKAKVHNDILAAMVAGGLDDAAGKLAISLVASGKVPHVKITY